MTKVEVIDVDTTEVKVRVRNECTLPSGVQIRLPSKCYENMPLLRGSDINDLKELYKKFPYEYISIPCVQSGTNLQEFKLSLGKELADKVEVVSKIDTIDGVQNFEGILEHTSAIIIQRSDLSLEFNPEKLVLA
jgi:pyruvate kinase